MLFALFQDVYQESDAAKKIQPLIERVYKDQIQAGNTLVSILLWIQVQAHLFIHHKLEGKLLFNGGGNGEAATGMGNEMSILHHSFPVCPWPGPGPGLEIKKTTKTMNGKLMSQQSLMI